MRIAALIMIAALSACAAAPDGPARDIAGAPAAAAPAASFTTAVEAESGRYELDPRHASVVWRVRHQGLSWYVARFAEIGATLDFDAEDPSRSRLEAHVDANSVDTGLPGGAAGFNQSIARALGAQTAPDIALSVRSIERTGENTGRMIADLTMNGQTHPASFDVVFNGETRDILRGGKRVLGFSATGRIDRTQWGVDAWRQFVGAAVEIAIEAEFVKA